jgi:hypothetical protein
MGIKDLTPLGVKFFTTWNWWAAIAVSALHLLNLTPKFIAAGFFPLALGVAITGSSMHAMCNTTNICSTRRYREYSKKYRLKHNSVQLDEIFTSKNISTHLLPLLIISAVLLVRPSNSAYLERLLVAAGFALVYNIHAYYHMNKDITKVYGMDKNMYGWLTLFLVVCCLIPV